MKISKNLIYFSTFLILVGFSSQLKSQQLVDVAKSHLTIDNDEFTIDPDDMILMSTHTSQQSGLTYFYFNQAHNGIKIYNAISNVVMDKDNKLFTAGKRFIEFDSADPINPRINALTSVEEVGKHFNLPMTATSTILRNDLVGVDRQTTLQNASMSEKDIKTSLMYVNDKGKLHLCWAVAIQKSDDHFWWDVKVSALDGSIVQKTSWTVECNFGHNEDVCDHSNHSHDLISMDYRPNRHLKTSEASSLANGDYQVLAMPVESPNHGNITIVNSPWNDNRDASAHPFDWHNDGSNNFFTTRGNNVWAVEDRNGNNQSGSAFSPTSQLSGGQQYLYPPDFNNSPVDYQEGAITNLFYWNNIVHDVMYHYGFDEAAGNFQETNATGSGSDGDFVFADAQDGSGTNNATFGTPPDGGSPRMTMFEWTQSPSTTFQVTSPFSAFYFTIAASFGGNATFAGEVVEVDDSTGSTHEACSANPISNGGELGGKIALIDRGNCDFTEKVINAEAEGAIAAVICNNVPGAPVAIGGSAPFPNIPVVMISQSDCATLRVNLPASINVVASSSTVNRDSDYDNVVIAHEYGHGISTRLTGGRFSAGCLFNEEQMGEGWSDYFGLIFSLKTTDTGPQSKGIGTYLIGQSPAGRGIRPFPYSTDFALNPMTYNSSRTAAVPHGVGTVWCTALWEMTWDLIDIYGIGTDIYDSDIANAGTLANPSTFGGQNLALQLVTEGLKIQPCNPGFVDGRDAILAADQALYGGIHETILWEAFARRGLGVNASQGSTDSNSDNVESFDVPTPTGPEPGDECDAIPMIQSEVVSYAGGQDNGLAVANGNEIVLTDNAWKAIPLNYTITANTYLNFEFRATEEGEEHSIGLDSDLSIANETGRRFRLYGTQPGSDWIPDFNNYNGSGDYVRYSIPIGEYYTGNMNYLFFVMDNDANPSLGDSHFRNITLVEDANGNDAIDECLPCNELAGTICNDGDLCTPISFYNNNCECNANLNLALNGTASMSSLFSSQTSADNLNDDVLTTGLAHTTGDSPNEWMDIDLGVEAMIGEIVLWNRGDCCLDRQNNIYVLISSDPFPTNTDLTAALNNASFSFQFGDITGQMSVSLQANHFGRYVRVQKSGTNPGGNFLNLRELQVFTTSENADSDGDGVCDVDDICMGGDDNVDTDGDGIPDFCDCALTGQTCDDGDNCTTGETYDGDCECNGGILQDSDNDGVCDANDQCPDMDDAMIGTPCDDGDACTTGEEYDANCQCSGGVIADSDNDGTCDGMDQCPNFDDDMIGQACNPGSTCAPDFIYTDCNCEPVENAALNGTAAMSSQFSGNTPASNLNNDIITGNELAHTDGDSPNEWVQIDLGSTMFISTVVIHNRTSCCSNRINNVYVMVADTPFPSNTDLTQSINNADVIHQLGDETNSVVIGVDINQMGRYIRIQKSGNNLDENWINLVEMQVYTPFTVSDSDNDGVCDADDICMGGDDSADTDGDGIPDHCDPQPGICVDSILNQDNSLLTNSLQVINFIESNNVIPSNADVEFTAGESITMNPGFEVESQAVFHAYIEECQ